MLTETEFAYLVAYSKGLNDGMMIGSHIPRNPEEYASTADDAQFVCFVRKPGGVIDVQVCFEASIEDNIGEYEFPVSNDQMVMVAFVRECYQRYIKLH